MKDQIPLQDSLNQQQREAVDHSSGSMLVVAGAGTGKTRVIVERINKLLDQGVEAKHILAVTFTEKAAAEMLDRVLELRKDINIDLPIMTFNAFGESLLREYNTDIGLSRNFLLLGDSAKIVFMQQHLGELELDYYSHLFNPAGLLPDLAKYFSQLKQHVVTPEAYKAFVSKMPENDEPEKLEKAKHQELARAFGNFVRLCKENNVIDYDDQIYRVIELLTSRPNVQRELQDKYASIMIDEFQDTNPMQSRLIDLLVGKENNLMVVGDDDQSIYGFRGATLSNILAFKDRYPGAKEVTLTENYRSSQAILDGAYKLVQNNNPHRLEAKLGISKKLHAQTIGKPPVLEQFSSIDHEIQWIADDIKQRLDSGEQPGEIAVLCRRKVTSHQISYALQLANVDHIVIGESYQLYKTEVVRIIMEAVRCVVDSSASTSLYHTLSGALFNADASLLADAASQARREHKSLEQYIQDQDSSELIGLIDAVVQIKKWREHVGTMTVGKLIYKMITETGYKDKLYREARDSRDAEATAMQLSEFFHTLKEFESIATIPTALQYIQSFPVLEAAGESNEDGTLQVSNDSVNILTIHKSKGLEWGTVYLPDCVEGSFPMKSRGRGIKLPEALVINTTSEADSQISEERRLMYVAMTRAKENLTITYSARHRTKTQRKPSRFIAEIFGAQPEINGSTTSEETAVPNFEIINQNTFALPSVSIPKSIYDGTTISLSVSKIKTFLNCPLDFYYKFVLNVPEPASPAAGYGTALHGVIETINKALVTGTKALVTGTAVRLADLEKELKDSFKIDGYDSPEHKERSEKQATETLRNFYEQHYVVDKKIPYLVESPFSVKLMPENVKISGRLDVVFETENGIEIRDYKTGTYVSTSEKAKQQATASKQLTLYALIWQELHGELPNKLSLEFVDTRQLGSVRKTQRGVDTMRANVASMAESIKANEFSLGTDHTFCQHPDFSK